MASQRKTPSHGKRTAPAAKKAAPKKAAPRKPAKPARPPAKAPARKPAPVAKKPAPVAKKPAAKPAAPKRPAAKAPAPKAPPPKARKLKAVARPPVTGANVRPLGVLPASARARGSEHFVPPPSPARPASPVAKRRSRARGPQRLTADELLELEEKLREERAKLMKEMGHLESTVLKVNPRDSAGDLSGYSFHMADAGTDAYEREQAFQTASSEGRLLREFNEALRRLYSGEYGVCESCGNAISRARLLAIPTARLCRDCKEKEERGKPSSQ